MASLKLEDSEYKHLCQHRYVRCVREIVVPDDVLAEWGKPSGYEPYDVFTCKQKDGTACVLVAGDHGYTDPITCPYGTPGDSVVALQQLMSDGTTLPHIVVVTHVNTILEDKCYWVIRVSL